MCIGAAVGQGAKNLRADVKTVQLLLQLCVTQAGVEIADGVCGPATVAAIKTYQQGIVGHTDADGVVAPNGSTLQALRYGVPAGWSMQKMQGILIHAAEELVRRFYASLLDAMERGFIDTPLRQAHFLAQLAHESGELRYTQELANGEKYEGRKDLGNTEPGDGPRFKGRGLIQLTGRSNYIAFGKAIGQDLTRDSNMLRVATDPQLAVEVAVWFWTKYDLNALADQDDVLAITRKINGGTNGLEDRKEKLERAKYFLVPQYRPAAVQGWIHAMEARAKKTVIRSNRRRRR